MKPMPRFNTICDKQFVIGETYQLVVDEERSWPAHRRYFACVREGWKNLPENIAPLFQSPEHLRKWTLIKIGYSISQSMVCESAKDAAVFAKIMQKQDKFIIAVHKGLVLTFYTARSQSVRHMNKADFADSSNKVLDYISAMISVSRADLETNADQAA